MATLMYKAPVTRLRTTGEIVKPLPWAGMDKCPWDQTKYHRVMLPPQAPRHACRVEIVNKINLIMK